MNYLNKQIQKLYQIKEEDYVKYCNRYNLEIKNKETVKNFIYNLRTKKITRSLDGDLILKEELD